MYVESHGLNRTLILTDSLSCLQDLAKSPFRSRHNYSIILQIKQLLYRCHCLGLQITLAWIPSHSGIIGNENADSIARVAIQSGIDSYIRSCYPRDLCCDAKPSMMKSWNTLWQKPVILKENFMVQYSLLFLLKVGLVHRTISIKQLHPL